METIVVPVTRGQPLYLYGESHVPLVRSRANRLYLNPFTYEVLNVQCAEEINTLTWINDIADPLHFGYLGGLPAKLFVELRRHLSNFLPVLFFIFK